MPVSADHSAMHLQFGHGVEAVENSVRMIDHGDSGPDALQFGHGVEAVENFCMELAAHFAARLLQFGHGVEAVENDERGGDVEVVDQPSIRPRR